MKDQLCPSISREQGFATIWYMIAIVLIISLASFVLSEGYANVQQNKIKTAMNRAVKAATMQYDTKELSENAKIVIPQGDAEQEFKTYLTDNLKLDNDLNPREDSVFDHEFQVVDFSIIDEGSIPYTVDLSDVRFRHTFEKPGVLAVVETTVTDIWGTGDTTYYVPAVAEVDLAITTDDEEEGS
ncbi:hypothetical protein ACFQ4A_15700 [Lentibacillus salinarum]|uniref:Flp pilus-assembly TadG-like N-terminal domain-containing protein n=1 Tax=Lentibacillus salinarum TaxID=446820 RepID=A0ABW3ZY12_9BACI